MGYEVPSLSKMFDEIRAFAKALLPTRNFGSARSTGWKFIKTFAAGVTDNHAHISAASKDANPGTASGTALDGWIDVFAPGGNRKRKGATPARKTNAGRVRGNTGSPISYGELLVHRPSGLRYQIGETTTMPVAEFQDVDIIAIDTGSQTRLAKGEVLEFLSTPAGLQKEVELQLALDENGFDSEQDGAASNRLLDAIREPQAGGNQADYVAWSEALDTIDSAYCYPCRAGVATVDVVALHAGAGSARSLSDGERAELLAVLQDLAPITPAAPGGALRVLKTIATGVGTEVLIVPDGAPQNAFDWEDIAGSPPVVLTWVAGTRTMTFPIPRPPTMKAGDRIVIRGLASSQQGEPIFIESLSGSSAIVLQAEPVIAPAPGDQIYAGGPLTAAIRDALIGHINGETVYLGATGPVPASTAAASGLSLVNLPVLARGMGPANPGGRYGAWAGGLFRSTIAQIVMSTRGVRNHSIAAPLTDQEAIDYEFPLDYQVQLNVFSFVLVRRSI